MKATIQFKLNGESRELAVDADRMLLWVLRSDLGLTGTKYSCGAALCGACTVLIDGVPARSCAVPVTFVDGCEVTTIEGLAKDGELHPLQRAFAELDALQCGFCTPGMILNAYGLLRERPNPTRADIVAHMENNLCRCAGYERVIRAIEKAAAELRGGGR